MRIILFSIMLVLNLNQGCTKNILKEVSLAISKEQLKEGLRKKGEDYYHTIRTKLIELDSLDIFQNSDTLFSLKLMNMRPEFFTVKYGALKQKSITHISEEHSILDKAVCFLILHVSYWRNGILKQYEKKRCKTQL